MPHHRSLQGGSLKPSFKTVRPAFLLTGLGLLWLIAFANLLGPRTSAAETAGLTTPTAWAYLPLIRKQLPGISGRVALSSTPTAGVSLELGFYNGSSWSTLATTTTGADGGFSFTGVPSLGPGQKYDVRYENLTGTPGRLRIWGTRELTSYAAGSEVEIGNFDIADIALVAPADGATVSLPYTFQWTPRPATPSDTYEFDLYDPTDGDPYFAPPLGYVGSYTLSGLPASFSPCVQYAWEIWVYSPDGGFGISYKTRVVFFANSGVAATPTPAVTPIPSATPTATATPLPVTPPAAGDWRTYVNYYRAVAHLPGLSEEPAWSDGAWKHARYMVKNDVIGHTEDPGNPWYSPEGATAAANSNVMVSSDINATDRQAIDLWMQGPFHGVGIIDPALLQTGFGSYREAGGIFAMGAALNVLCGLTSTVPATVTFPIKWPDHNTTVYLRTYDGGETPDPLTSCPGFGATSGLPVILQIGSGNLTPAVTASSFKQGSTSLEHCVFDETNYYNSIQSLQDLGRSILNARDAIVLIPKAALAPGATYTASITVNGQTHTWSFAVSSAALSFEAPSGAVMR